MKTFLTRRRFAKGVVGSLAATPILTASGLWLSTGLPLVSAQSNGALDPAPSRLDLFSTFGKQTGTMQHTWFDNGVWYPWENLGGTLVTGSAAAASWAPGRLDIFGVGTDYTLQHKWFDNGAWSGWESLGGNLDVDPSPNVLRASDLSAVSWSQGRIDVFATSSDQTLQHTWFDNGIWYPWESLGGSLADGPTVASWSQGRLDIFAAAGNLGTGYTLQHTWFDNSGWSPWENLGGSFVGSPTVASWSRGRLDIFANGLDGSLQHKWFDSGIWYPWESLGPSGEGEPTVTSGAQGRLDIFAMRRDGPRPTPTTLQHKWFSQGQWLSGWETLGSQAGPTGVSDPAVVSW